MVQLLAQAALMHNPFRQSPAYWQLSFVVPKPAVDAVEQAFADMAVSVSSFEQQEDGILWRVELLCEEKPGKAEISRRTILIKTAWNIELPPPEIHKVESRDWAAEVQRSFPPLHIGRYFVHGSHVLAPRRSGRINLLINAGGAFGSGEHATTSGCLEAFDQLARHRAFSRMLDMGCGSAILAIAMAKTWKAPVLAVDVDPVSVQVAQENIRLNQAQRWVTAITADGYKSAEVSRRGPYDLIAANILARPLTKFAASLARHLLPGGITILSGLLASQEAMVRAAHQMQGLRLIGRVGIQGWHTLLMQK